MTGKTPRFLVVGSVNMDLVLQTTRIPSEGESLFGGSYSYVPGGKGANQAVAAARLGAGSVFLGKVGNDAHGEKLKEQLEKQGVSTEFLTAGGEKSQTGLAVVLLDSAGQNRIIVYPGANMEITPSDVKKAFNGGHYDAVILQLEIPADIVLEACDAACANGIPVVLDAGPAQSFPMEKLPGLHILSPNETEARALTGVEINTTGDAARAAKMLMETARAKYVVIKLGEKGALLYDGKNAELFGGHKVETVVDTTAAGDAFTAALATCYFRNGNNIEDAIRYANAAGASAVTVMGAQPSLPTDAEVNRFLKGMA